MTNLRVKFTRWYYRKGYRMVYKPCGYADGVVELVFSCPFWVRPLVELFFSPCIYYREAGYDFGDGFDEGVLDADCISVADLDDNNITCEGGI